MIRRRALDARSVARDAWTAAFPTTGSRVRNTAFLKRWCRALRAVEIPLRRVRRALPFRDRTLTSRTRPLTTQDDILRRAVAQYKGKNWKKIGACARHSPANLPSRRREVAFADRLATRVVVFSARRPGARVRRGHDPRGAAGADARAATRVAATQPTSRRACGRRASPARPRRRPLTPPTIQIRPPTLQPSTSRSARTCSACTAGRRF